MLLLSTTADPSEDGWRRYYASREGPTDYSDTASEGYHKPDILTPGVARK